MNSSSVGAMRGRSDRSQMHICKRDGQGLYTCTEVDLASMVVEEASNSSEYTVQEIKTQYW